jgi:hypothetical protein
LSAASSTMHEAGKGLVTSRTGLEGARRGRRTGIATSPFPRRAVWVRCANALTVRQFGSPHGDPPCDPGGRSRDLRSTRPIGRSSRPLIEAGNTGASNAGLQCVSCLPFVSIVGPTRYNILASNEICHFSGLCRMSGRHGATFCHLIRYVIFSGHADYPTDTRKPNGSIDLWPIQFSDCRADTRKSNPHNDLCQTLILAVGRGAMRARRSDVSINGRGRN